MLRIIAVFLISLVMLIAPALAGETTIKLLTIGNSFADDSTAFLANIAAATGRNVVLFRANLGGHSLEQHAGYLKAYEANPNEAVGHAYKNRMHPLTKERKDFSLVEALQAEQWDYVTIQQVSYLSYQPETFEPYAGILISAIRKHAPKAQILVHETWAYREDASYFKNSDLTQPLMYERLHAAYQQLAKRYDLKVIPVGTAFQEARAMERWKYQADTTFDYTSAQSPTLPNEKGDLAIGWTWRKNQKTGGAKLTCDSKHANAAGRYLGATVFYHCLFPDAPESSFVPNGLTSDEAAQLRSVALSLAPKAPPMAKADGI